MRLRFVLLALLAVALSVIRISAADAVWKEVVLTEDLKKAPVGEKGRLWYRAKVSVPAEWRGRMLELVVEAIDDAREIYFGGQLIGRLGELVGVLEIIELTCNKI